MRSMVKGDPLMHVLRQLFEPWLPGRCAGLSWPSTTTISCFQERVVRPCRGRQSKAFVGRWPRACPVIEDVKRQHHGIPTRRTTPARPGGSVAACLRDGQTGNSEGGVSISIHHCLIYRFPKKRHTPAGTMKAGVLPMDGPGASHHPRPILGGRLGLAIAGEHRTTGLVLDEAVPRGPYEFPNLLHGPDRQHIS